MVGKITSLGDKTFFSGFLKASILYSWIAITTRAIIDPIIFRISRKLGVMGNIILFYLQKIQLCYHLRDYKLF